MNPMSFMNLFFLFFRYWLAKVFLVSFFISFSIQTIEAQPSVLSKKKAKKEVTELMKKAEDHFFHERFHIALRLFNLVIQQDPENGKAWRFAGDCYLQKRQLDKAKEYFQTAKEISKKPEKEWFRLGQVFILQGNGKKAIHSFEKALEHKKNIHLAHFYLGLAYYRFFQDKKKTIHHWEIYRKHTKAKDKRKIEQALEILRQKNYKIPVSTKTMDLDNHSNTPIN